MSGKGQYGDSYFVERSYPSQPHRRPLLGRATTPERASRLAARYRAIGGEPGVVVAVTAASGARWPAWVWDATTGWRRALSGSRT